MRESDKRIVSFKQPRAFRESAQSFGKQGFGERQFQSEAKMDFGELKNNVMSSNFDEDDEGPAKAENLEAQEALVQALMANPKV